MIGGCLLALVLVSVAHADGRQVYESQGCAMCHSVAGSGNRRHPLDGVGGRLSRDDIRTWIVAPQEMQPGIRKKAYDSLPKGELEALLDYLQTLR